VSKTSILKIGAFVLSFCVLVTSLSIGLTGSTKAYSGDFYCGPKALSQWLNTQGVDASVEDLTKIISPKEDFGSDMFSIEMAAKSFIPNAEIIKTKLPNLASLGSSLIFIGNPDTIGHYIVINNISANQAEIYNPATDISATTNLSNLTDFSGYALTSSPEGFDLADNDVLKHINGKFAWLVIASRGGNIIVTLGSRVIQFAHHNAHHFFNFLGSKAPHWQINTWIQQVKNSGKVIRIPWFW
jgi:ABC-type bacteriocin/lantibiotic exporter with double-glycine peptidase domain